MKCIIIGLGNFGMALAQRLTAMGYEVIGVDKDIDKVNAYKDSIKNTICLNLNNEQAARNLPLKDADLNIVSLGKDAGASILTVAILKQNGAKRIIVRAISTLHKTVLEAMGITEIIQLEKEYADFFATKTELTTLIYSYQVSPDYYIYEMKLPPAFVGRRLGDIKLEKDFSLKLIAIKHYDRDEEKGIYAWNFSKKYPMTLWSTPTMCLFFSVNATDSGYFRAIEPENLDFLNYLC